jgi:1-acyl-sn-glycerol-3-phosphate acyltransferase
MRLYYRFCRFICQMGFLLYFRGRIFGLGHVPDRGGVLLVCNHQSYLDPVLATLALHREGNYMARDTLFSNRLFRVLIESLNAFPVRRGSADVGAIKETMRRLRDGKVVVTFPEATRTRDGRIGRLHGGFASVAKRTGAWVVPVVIEGAFESWPRWRRLPGPHRIVVVYGKPIAPRAAAGMPPDELVQRVRDRLVTTQTELRRRLGVACPCK